MFNKKKNLLFNLIKKFLNIVLIMSSFGFGISEIINVVSVFNKNHTNSTSVSDRTGKCMVNSNGYLLIVQ